MWKGREGEIYPGAKRKLLLHRRGRLGEDDCRTQRKKMRADYRMTLTFSRQAKGSEMKGGMERRCLGDQGHNVEMSMREGQDGGVEQEEMRAGFRLKRGGNDQS
jgi:hypothetical protein